jgi:hypothetical protein
MSQRIDRSWVVLVSLENPEHDRCVDFFSRQDGSYGFEEFRRDAEDGGRWTPVQYYSGMTYPSPADALHAAERCVHWLADVVTRNPGLRTRIGRGQPRRVVPAKGASFGFLPAAPAPPVTKAAMPSVKAAIEQAQDP